MHQIDLSTALAVPRAQHPFRLSPQATGPHGKCRRRRDRRCGASAPRLSSRVIGSIAVALALLSAAVTFAVLAGLTPIAPTHQVVVTVLAIDALAALLLIVVIGREVWNIMQARRHGRAGARLHVRIIGLFSVIAAVPAILVAIVASITLDRGLAPWFSSRIQSVIQNSLTVAQLYLNEQGALIRSEIAAMAFDVSRAKPLFDGDRERFQQFLNAQAQGARPAADA